LIPPAVRLVADAGLDQHKLALGTQQEGVKADREAMHRVKVTGVPLPHHPRHQPECRPGIEVELTIGKEGEIEVAEAVGDGHRSLS
jgi:hypothetical protein